MIVFCGISVEMILVLICFFVMVKCKFVGFLGGGLILFVFGLEKGLELGFVVCW